MQLFLLLEELSNIIYGAVHKVCHAPRGEGSEKVCDSL